jgi:hypothetical protein
VLRIVDSTVFTLTHDFLVLDAPLLGGVHFLLIRCFTLSSLLAVLLRYGSYFFISMLFAVYSATSLTRFFWHV